MLKRLAILPVILCGVVSFAHAQDTAQPRSVEDIIRMVQEGEEAPAQTEETAIPEDMTPPVVVESTEIIVEETPAPQYETKAYAVLQTLDKLTARTNTVTVPVGKAVSVGPLFMDVKTCKKTPPTEKPEAATFIQVWEIKRPEHSKTARKTEEKNQSQWVFSGWMFAPSPALSAINHPVYDVWLKDCVDGKASAKSSDAAE